MPNEILVPIDFSDASRAALDYGAALARRLGARLTTLHVAPPPFASYDPLPTFTEPRILGGVDLDRIQERLRRFVTPPASELPLGKVAVRIGDPAHEILAFAAARRTDFIVLGTHGRRGVARWVLGSVTEQVAREATCPVVAVPPSAETAVFKRILCALDLSDSSPDTLDQAGRLAAATRVPLLVLHVVNPSRWYDPWPVAAPDEGAVRRALGDSARERLGKLIARLVPDSVDVDVLVAFGEAHGEIERIARGSNDLVVLGMRGGFTARHVLRSAVRPVVLLHRRTSEDRRDREETEETVASS